MFIPGFYHVRIAYYAWKGYRGYSFEDIPDFDWLDGNIVCFSTAASVNYWSDRGISPVITWHQQRSRKQEIGYMVCINRGERKQTTKHLLLLLSKILDKQVHVLQDYGAESSENHYSENVTPIIWRLLCWVSWHYFDYQTAIAQQQAID